MSTTQVQLNIPESEPAQEQQVAQGSGQANSAQQNEEDFNSPKAKIDGLEQLADPNLTAQHSKEEPKEPTSPQLKIQNSLGTPEVRSNAAMSGTSSGHVLTRQVTTSPKKLSEDLKKKLSKNLKLQPGSPGYSRQFNLQEFMQLSPSERLQRKLEFFGMHDKNPDETEERIQNVLDTIKTRFGPAKNGKHDKDAEHFAEMLAIEAEFGEPLIKQEDAEDGLRDGGNSQWAMFYECISRKKKFTKLKDCINIARKEKTHIAKEQQLQMLKDLYSKKSAIKSTKISGQEAGNDEETQKKVLMMVEEEKKMKEGLRMKIIEQMIGSILEQKDFENARLESFRNFIKYKYPILSPKRSSVERQMAGIDDHAEAPSRIECRWTPGVLQLMREQSRTSSPARSKGRSSLRKTMPLSPSPLNLFQQDESLMSATMPAFPATNPQVTSQSPNAMSQGQGQGGCQSLSFCGEGQDFTLDTTGRDIQIIGLRQAPFGVFDPKQTQHSRDSNTDLTGDGVMMVKQVRMSNKGSNSRNPSPMIEEVQSQQRKKEAKATNIKEDSRAIKAYKLPVQALNEVYWKRHLKSKQLTTVNQVNSYADEVASEMTLFAADRLELLMAHLHAELAKLKDLKVNRKRGRKKSSKREDGMKAQGYSLSKSPDSNSNTPHDEFLAARTTKEAVEELEYKSQPAKNKHEVGLPGVPQLGGQINENKSAMNVLNQKENGEANEWYQKSSQDKPPTERQRSSIELGNRDVTEFSNTVRTNPALDQSLKIYEDKSGADLSSVHPQPDGRDQARGAIISPEISKKSKALNAVQQSSETGPTLANNTVKQNVEHDIAFQTSPKTAKTKVEGEVETNYMRDSMDQNTNALANQVNQSPANRKTEIDAIGKQQTMHQFTTPPLESSEVMLKQQVTQPSDQYAVPEFKNQARTLEQPQMEHGYLQNSFEPAPQFTKQSKDDGPFNVSHLTKFRKQDKKMTKARITIAFHLLKTIREGKLNAIDFDWVKTFENSILDEETYAGIIPTLMVLKRYARTDKDNISLRAVLAKKLYEIKLQVGGVAVIQDEEAGDSIDQHGRDLASFYLTKDEERSISPQMFREQNNESAGTSLYKEREQLTKNKRPSSTNKNQSLISNPNASTIISNDKGYEKFVDPETRFKSPRPPPTAPARARVKSYNRAIQANQMAPGQNRYGYSQKSRNAGSTISIKNTNISQVGLRNCFGPVYQLPKLQPGQSITTSQNIVNTSTNVSGKSSLLSPRQIRNIQQQYMKRRKLTGMNEDAQIVLFPSPPRQREQALENAVSVPSGSAHTAKLRFKARTHGGKLSEQMNSVMREKNLTNIPFFSHRNKQMVSLDFGNTWQKGVNLYANLPKPTFGKSPHTNRSVAKSQRKYFTRPLSPEKQNLILSKVIKATKLRQKNKSPTVLQQPQLSTPGHRMTNAYGTIGVIRQQNKLDKLVADQTRVLPNRKTVIRESNEGTIDTINSTRLGEKYGEEAKRSVEIQ